MIFSFIIIIVCILGGSRKHASFKDYIMRNGGPCVHPMIIPIPDVVPCQPERKNTIEKMYLTSEVAQASVRDAILPLGTTSNSTSGGGLQTHPRPQPRVTSNQRQLIKPAWPSPPKRVRTLVRTMVSFRK